MTRSSTHKKAAPVAAGIIGAAAVSLALALDAPIGAADRTDTINLQARGWSLLQMKKEGKSLRDKLQGYSTEKLMSFIKFPTSLSSPLSSSLPGVSVGQIWEEVQRRDLADAYFEQLKAEEALRVWEVDWKPIHASALPGAKDREKRSLEWHQAPQMWQEELAKTQEYKETLRQEVLSLLSSIGAWRSPDHQLNENDFRVLQERATTMSTITAGSSFKTAWEGATQREKFLKEILGRLA